MCTTALLKTQDLVVCFRAAAHGETRSFRAVDNVSISMGRAETLGIVGESGSGKTTLARAILKLVPPSSGSIFFNGTDITHLSESGFKPFRKQMQVVFQDPYGALNPRMRIGEILTEPLIIHKIGDSKNDRLDMVRQTLNAAGLDDSVIDRYPHEFSGGQRQRICIARALILSPLLVICDEPTSALDVSVQAQIASLLINLQQTRGISYLLISHDIALVSTLSHRIAVMYRGQIVEHGQTKEIISKPLHPYTQLLLLTNPGTGQVNKFKHFFLNKKTSPEIPAGHGCQFYNSCSRRCDICKDNKPTLRPVTSDHSVACCCID